METAKQTALMEQPEILELFRVLEGNGLEKSRRKWITVKIWTEWNPVWAGVGRTAGCEGAVIPDPGQWVKASRSADHGTGRGEKYRKQGEKIHTVRKI